MMTTVTNERPSGAELLALYDAAGWTAYTRPAPSRTFYPSVGLLRSDEFGLPADLRG